VAPAEPYPYWNSGWEDALSWITGLAWAETAAGTLCRRALVATNKRKAIGRVFCVRCPLSTIRPMESIAVLLIKTDIAVSAETKVEL